MTNDMNKFVKFSNHYGVIIRVGNDASYDIMGIWSITLDGHNNIDEVYFVDGLKHNLLSVG